MSLLLDYERHGPCPFCCASLGCAVDCDNAPWNHDLPNTTPLVYLKRLVRWCRSCTGKMYSYARSGPIGFTLSDLRWVRR